MEELLVANAIKDSSSFHLLGCSLRRRFPKCATGESEGTRIMCENVALP